MHSFHFWPLPLPLNFSVTHLHLWLRWRPSLGIVGFLLRLSSKLSMSDSWSIRICVAQQRAGTESTWSFANTGVFRAVSRQCTCFFLFRCGSDVDSQLPGLSVSKPTVISRHCASSSGTKRQGVNGVLGNPSALEVCPPSPTSQPPLTTNLMTPTHHRTPHQRREGPVLGFHCQC